MELSQVNEIECFLTIATDTIAAVTKVKTFIHVKRLVNSNCKITE